ncbi:MAG: hypothetical protein MUQ10_00425 [Anaerolineae bacterium]|nr:hypothetical protein [Anaerolineae bacterium]
MAARSLPNPLFRTIGDQYAGYGTGGGILRPGEETGAGINYTAYDDGEVTFRQCTKLLVIYDDRGCRWIDPRDGDESQFTAHFVTIPNPRVASE